jgi:hypothetical protein
MFDADLLLNEVKECTLLLNDVPDSPFVLLLNNFLVLNRFPLVAVGVSLYEATFFK